MKKLIDLPDEIVKDLKVMAVENDSSFKAFIENLILRHHEFSKNTELTNITIEDGQPVRAFINYFADTYKGIKGHFFNFDQYAFTNYIEFLEHIKSSAEFAIQMVLSDDEFEEETEN